MCQERFAWQAAQKARGGNLAASPAAGVVDHVGRVFGHPDLYVLDGAVVPRAIGLNPSKTIAALAERAVALIIKE